MGILAWIFIASLRFSDTRPDSQSRPVSVRSPFDRHLEEIRLSIFRSGELDWDLWASEAVADEYWDRVQLKTVRLESRLNDMERLVSHAPEGRIDRPANLFGLEGGVLTVAVLDMTPQGIESGKPKVQTLEIRSDRMEAADQQDKAKFIGNVRALTEEYDIRSEELDANYDPKTHEVVGFTARGTVRVIDRKDPATRGEGQQAVYDKRAGEILLTGEPRLIQGDKISTGDKVRIDTNTKHMSVIGSEKTPVRTVVPEKDVRR